jgi:hypothetical protein
MWGEARQGLPLARRWLIWLGTLTKMGAMPGSLPPSFTYAFYGLIAWGLSALFVAFRILAQEKLKLGVAFRVALLAWLGVPAVLAFQGVFLQMGQTPPYLMRVVIPMGLLIFALALSPWGKWAAERLPLSFLVGVNGFRLPLELLLYALATHELLPLEMTLKGYNFDIATGILALVLWILVHKQSAPLWALWAFNILGTVLLVTVVTIAVLSFPEPFGLFTPPNLLVAFYPWIWLPTFLVPLALLSHLLIYRKLLLPPPPPRANI